MRLLKQQQKLWSPLYRGPKIDIPRDCYWTCFYKNKKLRDSKKVFYFDATVPESPDFVQN